jgi:N-acetylneuraminic acid mutarotase
MRWRPSSRLLLLPALAAALAAVASAAAGCGAEERQSNSLLQNPSRGWERVASMSQRRSYVAAARLGDRIFAAGGMVGETGRPLATFSRYDPAHNEWSTLAQLPVATRAAAAAALDGRVVVVGGTTPDGNTSAVWVWDGRRWSARAPLPRAVFNHAAVTLGGRLYVLGGYADGAERREVWRYDPAADRWAAATRLPRPNHAFGAVAFRGELWTIGGRRGERALREVWIWSPATGRWRRGPTMPKPMELLGATVAGDEIHAVWESTYQVYDARRRRWRQGPTPLVTRHALEAFAVDGRLFTVGGCTTALRDSPVVERLDLR